MAHRKRSECVKPSASLLQCQGIDMKEKYRVALAISKSDASPRVKISPRMSWIADRESDSTIMISTMYRLSKRTHSTEVNTLQG